MRRWESIESKMPKYRTQMEKRKLARHIKILALIVLISSLGDKKELKVCLEVLISYFLFIF